MKILSLIGSSRKNGNTYRIVKMIETHMQSLAAQHHTALDFEILHLGGLDIRPCLGCRSCFDDGEERCPLKDELALVRSKMDAADGLILASPVYMDDVSGLTKNLIDRLAYISHRPAFGGKCAYPIATVGGSSTSHTLRTMNAALLTWGYHLAGQTGLKMGAFAAPEEMSRYQPESTRAAERLFYAVVQQRALQPSFISLVTFKVQQLAWQREPPGSKDYAYWQDHGWLVPARTFYIANHRAHPFKVTLARLLGKIVFRFLV